LLTVGVNVVVPQSVMVRWPDVEMPVMVNVGSTTAILSAGECTSGMFKANVNAITVGAAVTGVLILSTLCMNRGDAGLVTAVDFAIAVVLAMFCANPNTTSTFRDVSSVLCSTGGVVTPDGMVSSQRVKAGKELLEALNDIDADAVPEFALVTTNDVDAQPFTPVVPSEPNEKCGNVMDTVSS
jgi:hypothetical protein